MTCRYCKQDNRERMVKYGTRHYAHFACFLELKGTEGLKDLHAWQLRQFPWILVKEKGIEPLMWKLIREKESREAS